MSLPELIAEIKTLSRADKACLMQTLLNDLVEDNTKLAQSLGFWELRSSPEAAFALQQMFKEELAKNKAGAT